MIESRSVHEWPSNSSSPIKEFNLELDIKKDSGHQCPLFLYCPSCFFGGGVANFIDYIVV